MKRYLFSLMTLSVGIFTNLFFYVPVFSEEPEINSNPIQEVRLINPIKGNAQNPRGIVDYNVIIGKIILAATGILGSITLIVFAYGGFQWLLSRGNSEMVTKGLNTMVYAAIGLCIIFGSYAILRTVFEGLGRAAGT